MHAELEGRVLCGDVETGGGGTEEKGGTRKGTNRGWVSRRLYK